MAPTTDFSGAGWRYRMETLRMNAQQIFDKVARHLLTQRRKSTDAGGGCVYRGLGGLSCAIGALIPDSAYDPALEGHYACELPVWEATGLSDEYIELGTGLQEVHDSHDVEAWPSALMDLAKDNGLSAAVVVEICAPDDEPDSPTPATER